MTQPNEAVGGSNEPVAAPTIDDRLSAALGAEPAAEEVHEEEDPLEIAHEGEQAEEGQEPEVEIEPEPEETGPPIEAPNSWDSEAKERFAKLPRADQEYIAKRENDRDRFLQQKAQEAVQVKHQITNEAMQAVQQLRQQQAEELENFAVLIAPQKPPYQLMAENPAEYAYQMQVYEHQLAQRQQVQQAAHQRRQEAQFIQQQQEQSAAAEQAQRIEAAMREHFPEYLDPNEGPKLREQLGAVAIDLGYSPEQLAQVDERDILAMKKAADWKAKAEKWDRAMAKQMERVREGKSKLPPVAKPGAAKGPGATQQAQYQADREAMRRGDKDAELRVLSRLFNS